MTKKSGQTIEYLENEDETKSLFHYFWTPFIKAIKTIFLGRWKCDFKAIFNEKLCSYYVFNTVTNYRMRPILNFHSFQVKHKLKFDWQIKMENILRSLLFNTEVNNTSNVYNCNTNHSAFFSFLNGTFIQNFDICMSVPLI